MEAAKEKKVDTDGADQYGSIGSESSIPAAVAQERQMLKEQVEYYKN